MRDAVFSAASVEAAVDVAARALGLPAARLRWVVLEPGSAGGRGLSPTPARIAVLLDEHTAAGPQAAPPPSLAPAEPSEPAPLLLALLDVLEQEIGEPLQTEVREEEEQGLVVRLEGPGRRWLLEGEGEVLAALDHLLRKVLQAHGHPGRLVLWCEGWRERRDAALRERAQELGRAVLQDGRLRRTEPLNAYERRLVHMAVAEVGGLQTKSEGEGHERVVTIVPAAPAEPA